MLDKVLCVDDDAITLMLCKVSLTKSRFAKEVITALNGQEAIDYFNKENAPSIDLILLDLNMPVKSGWDFLDEFVTMDKARETKVVILSSSADPRDFKKAGDYNPVITFINKPLTIDLLEALKKEESIKAKFN